MGAIDRGSEKQVAWAIKLREAHTEKLNKYIAEAEREAADIASELGAEDAAPFVSRAAILRETADLFGRITLAKWWIDNRDRDTANLCAMAWLALPKSSERDDKFSRAGRAADWAAGRIK